MYRSGVIRPGLPSSRSARSVVQGDRLVELTRSVLGCWAGVVTLGGDVQLSGPGSHVCSHEAFCVYVVAGQRVSHGVGNSSDRSLYTQRVTHLLRSVAYCAV